MSILTDPIFYFIDPVTNDNFNLNFIEPNKAATELTAELNVASYTHDQLDDEVSRALNAAGQNTYTVTFVLLAFICNLATYTSRHGGKNQWK